MEAHGDRLICPDCGQPILVPDDAQAGDLLECPECAGILFRLQPMSGRLQGQQVQMVSCPGTDQLVEILCGTPVGTVYHCDGRSYVLTYAFGSYALEASSSRS